ncbi:uncharacterized protein LOC8270192 [Ricinus communis]|uniref:CUE domain-containing protein n=1 Tax=Ricinus communis TaxID=3988 RepID=B9SME8_RICCO|nr:uncharacterized protein LOC8270192 [Ricinus communis]EEF35180.1 conserved hypothetical protein [Ricinus communis]|eukprot:XP_002527167.1 uncharacterized protein LOC8270192 [Ricinus communis]
MSAIVCGKRSFFEELPVTSPSTAAVVVSSKRIRCCSSPVRSFSPPRSFSPFSSKLDKLFALFPLMDKQIIERALEECGDDLDSAIRSLNELRLGSAADNSINNLDSNNVVRSDLLLDANVQQGVTITNAEAPPTDDLSASSQLPMDGAEWVELFVNQMMSASNMDDARARASRALEALEKSICARAGAETAKSFQQENMMLKEQVQALIQENAILKRAVSIQHERQKEFEDRSQELQHLKQLVSQYQDQLRALEVSNYALTMHLKQAQQSNSIPGRFHPDVF